MGHPTLNKIENNDVTMLVSAWGAALMSLKYKGKEMTLNRPENVGLIGKLADEDINPHYGATCGRVAGRIGNAKFTLVNGESVELEANNGPHSLHGGPSGYSRNLWTVKSTTQNENWEKKEVKDRNGNLVEAWGVTLEMLDFRKNRFPGRLRTLCHYLLTLDNEVHLVYESELVE